ncbi:MULTISPECIES: hypothetical protein [Xanthomonas]|uniref:Uncharacterized protein n=2 Tax=Xanthomonas TaxID=338 RepID=A0A7Z7NHS7_XANCH|nr:MULTISPECIES: hypothetical protein [Xanthomonas]ATS39270.1 hypothetical protein XcfCFBP6988P_15005 [Xanthomonas citri pv. phaseoli var. fuscans]ATS41923.1 hypothetical protein XcfCFBP6989P_05485 [Xanthomonas citri pv. phaseoli var. fuscans]ATS47273.1 hypothetical protein XcfCFBP6990P_11875 [Xanthomonas citri pv. phaseoli var. fuscans]ATS86348.1 hypothetical protein XcfCFBP6991P_22355 [Xanthomonas citri pv. phaseoli var. fuscans]QWN20915.1 hypothetical protein DGM98_12945 [Xanthomonas citri]
MSQEFDGSFLQQQVVDTRIERRTIPNSERLASEMTKREAFAMAEMQGFASGPHASWFDAQTPAICAVLWADVLLAALEQKA